MLDLLSTNLPRQDIAGPNGAVGELVGICEGDDDDDNIHIAGGDEGPGTLSDGYLGSSTFAPCPNAKRTDLHAFKSVRSAFGKFAPNRTSTALLSAKILHFKPLTYAESVVDTMLI